MTGNERRKRILDVLSHSNKPTPAHKLAEKFNVSRQVIVQDIALLRAKKNDIMATSRGYLLYSNKMDMERRVVAVQHDFKDMEKELRIVVDYGGRVIDVIVEHEVYGEIKADLMIETEDDIQEFIKQMEKNKALPLLSLKDGRHYHTIEAKNKKILDIIEKELRLL